MKARFVVALGLALGLLTSIATMFAVGIARGYSVVEIIDALKLVATVHVVGAVALMYYYVKGRQSS